MTPLPRLLLGLAGLTYPLWVWWGLRHWGVTPVAGLLALLALGRALTEPTPEKRPAAWGVAFLAGTLALFSTLFNDERALYLYPVLMNGFLLALFASSLRADSRPVVERLARLREPDLPEAGVRWCRAVTKVWCAFFVLNGTVALGTVLYGDPDLWALWNGALSYAAMGVLLAGERLFRSLLRRS